MDYKKLNAIIYAVLAALFYAINMPDTCMSDWDSLNLGLFPEDFV